MITMNNDLPDEIWKTTKNIRTTIKFKKFQEILLGLLFLRYINMKFELKHQELVAAQEENAEDPKQYEKENIYYLAEESRWNKISENSDKLDNKERIANIITQIGNNTPSLEKILPTVFSEDKNEINSVNLGEYIDLLSELDNTDENTQVLTDTFEKCLEKLSTIAKKEKGEFYTPPSIVKTVVKILQPTQGIIYDPCCGSGEFLVKSSTTYENKRDKKIYGQESDQTTWKIAKMNLIMHQIEANLGKTEEDAIQNDLESPLSANYIMAKPPFTKKAMQLNKEDKRWEYGQPKKINTAYAWMQHMIYHLAEDGKMAIVLPNSSLFVGGQDRKIRAKILESGIVEAIISLPTQLFTQTAIPVTIWIINKEKKQKDKILFIDAKELGTMTTRKQRTLEDKDIDLLLQTYTQYLEGTLEDEKGFCKVATLEDIKEQDYSLTTGRYVGFKQEEEYTTRNLKEILEDTKEKEKKITQLNKKIRELTENI